MITCIILHDKYQSSKYLAIIKLLETAQTSSQITLPKILLVLVLYSASYLEGGGQHKIVLKMASLLCSLFFKYPPCI